MELAKNGVKELYLRVLVFGDPYCSSNNSNEFNADYKVNCPFPCHIGSSIQAFRDIYLHETVRKKIFCSFLYKIDHVYVYQVYKNNSYKSLFSFLFSTTP